MRRAWWVVVAAGLACSGNTVGPENELEVSNQTDNFSFQVSDLSDVTQDFSYNWVNTGTQAVVDASASIGAGKVFLIIRDADNAIVYQEDLVTDGDGETLAGREGVWRVEVRLDGATGTFNFRVQKKT